MPKTKEELRCSVCNKLLAHFDEKKQCSYTDVPCGESFCIEEETGKAFCEKCDRENDLISRIVTASENEKTK